MKKSGLCLMVIGILTLSACGGGKKTSKTTPKKEKGTEVAFLTSDADTAKIAFLDEDIGAFEDVEAFVLNDTQDNASTNASHVSGEQLVFDLQEPTGMSLAEQEKQIVYFDYDSSQMRKDQEPKVGAVKQKIDEWVKKGYKVVFKGHSCKWHGTRDYNLALSCSRAQEMATTCGVTKENLKVFGVGNEELVAFDSTKDGQSPNRRVEIYPLIS